MKEFDGKVFWQKVNNLEYLLKCLEHETYFKGMEEEFGTQTCLNIEAAIDNLLTELKDVL